MQFEIKLHYEGSQKAVDLIESILVWLAGYVPGLDVIGTLVVPDEQQDPVIGPHGPRPWYFETFDPNELKSRGIAVENSFDYKFWRHDPSDIEEETDGQDQ